MSSHRGSRVRRFTAELLGFLRGPPSDDQVEDEVREHLRLLEQEEG